MMLRLQSIAGKRLPLWALSSRAMSLDASQGLKSTVCDVQDLDFQLFDVLQVHKTLFNDDHERFKSHNVEFVREALQSAHSIATESFAPHNRKNDLQEPKFDGKKVTIIPEVKEAITKFYDAGFGSAHADEQFGGLQLPSCVSNALMVPFYSANIGTATFPFLTIAAGNMLRKYGNEMQLQRFLQPMLEGRFTGTMNLSETQAGSSLGDISTKAFPRKGEPGKYNIKGAKMWISGGEHELSENIVHMVLAKVADPTNPTQTIPGVKGISLFIVPKFRVDENGTIGQRNDVSLAGLNKKMGWRGATNCVLNYGDNDGCIGELMGKEGEGLKVMFNMMNEARVSVGLIAASLGYNGYATSLNYARERRQGRLPENKDPAAPQVPIIEHADVKRMLLVQKAYCEGSLALCLFASYLVDATHYPGAGKSMDAQVEDQTLLDLLTPIVKSWPSEWCLEANKWAIQVHGGYGFERSYSVEQTYRDQRLNMIHEGTNGIQSLDLLGRKVKNGLPVFVKRVRNDIDNAIATGENGLLSRAKALEAAVERLSKTTDCLVGKSAPSPRVGMANSHEYLNMMGHTVIAWMWLRQETAALQRAVASPESQAFVNGKRLASEFFFNHELPKTVAQAKLLMSLDDVVLRMEDSFF